MPTLHWCQWHLRTAINKRSGSCEYAGPRANGEVWSLTAASKVTLLHRPAPDTALGPEVADLHSEGVVDAQDVKIHLPACSDTPRTRCVLFKVYGGAIHPFINY